MLPTTCCCILQMTELIQKINFQYSLWYRLFSTTFSMSKKLLLHYKDMACINIEDYFPS